MFVDSGACELVQCDERGPAGHEEAQRLGVGRVDASRMVGTLPPPPREARMPQWIFEGKKGCILIPGLLE